MRLKQESIMPSRVGFDEVDDDLRGYLTWVLINYGDNGMHYGVSRMGDPLLWAHAMDRGFIDRGRLTEAGMEFLNRQEKLKK